MKQTFLIITLLGIAFPAFAEVRVETVTMGGSYVGAVQWQAAVEQPPGLAAIAPQATWSSFYRNLYLGGAVRLALIAGWIAGNTAKPADVKQADMNLALMRLPLSEVDEAICGSLFPLYDRNPNTGEGPFGRSTAIATESVHHRPGALSRVILPVRIP
jgi:predicted acyl esterase